MIGNPRRKTIYILFTAFFLFLTGVFPMYGQSEQPRGLLHFETPSTTWDEAIPLGNGLLGALVWGDGVPLKVSLDRTDLWDLRPVPEFESEDYDYETMRKWVAEGRIQDLHRLYDDPYGNAGPTKIPAGRIEIKLVGEPAFKTADLYVTEALACMQFEDGTEAQVFVHATEPVGMIKICGPGGVQLNLQTPPFSAQVKDPAGPGKISPGDLASLGYKTTHWIQSANTKAYLQEGFGGFEFVAVLKWQKKGDTWLAAWSIATSDEGKDPLTIALTRCKNALEAGFEKGLEAHRAWWSSFWNRSSLKIPNAIIERQWYLETYKFGAAARADTPPITLQGPWTADNGKIPPWKGDYHHDLNTQLSYWPCYSGNHLEGGQGFVDWLWKTKKNAEAWTQRFFKKPGLNVPMTADLNNNQIGGWHQYTHSSTTAAWLSHHFYLHWRYSMDRDFLKNRAYPFVRDTAVFLEAVMEMGEDGKRTLPLSSSPEINDNRLEAWFPSITNYDLALIQWTFLTAAELAGELGLTDEAGHWKDMLAELPDLAFSPEDGRLLVAKDYPLNASHRHFSHLMAIHPLGLIQWEKGPKDQAVIKAALAELDRLGSSLWTGYSFSWLANLAARARDGALAEKALEIFSTAFCLRSSFHCNGDQSGKGYSNFRYRPFTLEGNFAAAAAVQEMLLQSYSGTIRVFPAVPENWKDASFRTLRAEGAFLVSAQRSGGLTRRVEIQSEKGGPCRLENPFEKDGFTVEGAPGDSVREKGQDLHLKMSPGQKVVLVRQGG